MTWLEYANMMLLWTIDRSIWDYLDKSCSQI